MTWHKLTIEKVFGELNSSEAGLTADEAAKRIQQYGPNQLQEKKKKPAWLLFLLQAI